MTTKATTAPTTPTRDDLYGRLEAHVENLTARVELRRTEDDYCTVLTLRLEDGCRVPETVWRSYGGQHVLDRFWTKAREVCDPRANTPWRGRAL